jgi:small subunit ribosomal protein S17
MKNLSGNIISDKMQKVAVVLIERQFRHPVYGKIIKKNKKIHAVNEVNAKTGDLVSLVDQLRRQLTLKLTK